MEATQVAGQTQQTMSWELVGTIFLIVHSPKDPKDAEYNAALQGYSKHMGRFNGILISSAGGGPNFAQRKRTTEFWNGIKMPTTVVMSSSQLTRGIITAMNWFLSESPIIATHFGEFPKAFSHLRVPPSLQPELEARVQALHRSLKS